MSNLPAGVPRPLPDRPNLRHLKAQAKDLLEAGAAASVTDAQFHVARLYGFASWPKLKAHVESLKDKEVGAQSDRLTPGSLVSAITTFLAGQDLLTLAEIRDALSRELEAAGPNALVQLHERLMAGMAWDLAEYRGAYGDNRADLSLARRVLAGARPIDG